MALQRSALSDDHSQRWGPLRSAAAFASCLMPRLSCFDAPANCYGGRETSPTHSTYHSPEQGSTVQGSTRQSFEQTDVVALSLPADALNGRLFRSAQEKAALLAVLLLSHGCQHM